MELLLLLVLLLPAVLLGLAPAGTDGGSCCALLVPLPAKGDLRVTPNAQSL
jgi:hypothetical protein